MSATLWDKATLLPNVGLILGKVAWSGLTGISRGPKQAEYWSEHVSHTLLRGILTDLSIGQLQIIMPSFVKSYEGWCKKHQHKPQVVDIPNTTVKGFWIGNPDNAKYTMVYFHGGGFVVPGLEPHLDMLARWLTWTNGNLAVFCVSYTLVPMALYPQQIGEGVEGLRYVLSLPNRKPSNVLIGGDSAGGALTLAILAHISNHPHPKSDIVKPLEVQEPLNGGIVIAPWVSSEDTASSKEFGNRDVVNKFCANYWIDTYKGGKEKSNDDYVVAEQADPAWWTGTKISRLLATAGEHEVLRDAICSWADKFEKGFGRDTFKLIVGKREIHDAPINPKPESELDKLGNDCQEAVIRDWLNQYLI